MSLPTHRCSILLQIPFLKFLSSFSFRIVIALIALADPITHRWWHRIYSICTRITHPLLHAYFIFFGQLFTKNYCRCGIPNKKLMYIQCAAAIGNILANFVFITFSYIDCCLHIHCHRVLRRCSSTPTLRTATPFLFASLRIGLFYSLVHSCLHCYYFHLCPYSNDHRSNSCLRHKLFVFRVITLYTTISIR